MVGVGFEVGVRMVARDPADPDAAADFATRLFLGGLDAAGRVGADARVLPPRPLPPELPDLQQARAEGGRAAAVGADARRGIGLAPRRAGLGRRRQAHGAGGRGRLRERARPGAEGVGRRAAARRRAGVRDGAAGRAGGRPARASTPRRRWPTTSRSRCGSRSSIAHLSPLGGRGRPVRRRSARCGCRGRRARSRRSARARCSARGRRSTRSSRRGRSPPTARGRRATAGRRPRR